MTLETTRILETFLSMIRLNYRNETNGLVAIVGTTCSGKSSVLDALEEHQGRMFYVAHEPFSALHGKGMPAPDRSSIDEVRLAQYATMVQHLIGENQASLQQTAHSVSMGPCHAVVDRPVYDFAQYLPGGIKEVEEILETTAEEMLKRYRLIIHLGHPPEEVFLRAWSRNPARAAAGPPDYARVLERSRLLDSLYGDLPNRVFIPFEDHWLSKLGKVVLAITD